MLVALTLTLAAQGPSTLALLPGEAERSEAIEAAGRSARATYLPPLIDLLAFAETREEWFALLDALGTLLSEDLRAVERPWRTLRLRLGSRVSGPPDYLAFKRELLARAVDPRFREILREDDRSELELERVDWGGVPVDGIPALVDPAVVPGAEASWLSPEEPVFGVVVGNQARAYPLRILDWHELVNDRLDEVSFALSYCTLCGAGVAYHTGDATNRDVFRTSGLLLDSNKLMFDVATQSLWSQLEGRALHGPRVGDPVLSTLPVDLVPWSVWRQRHPETTVVDLETGFDRDYREGAAYGNYFAAAETMFPAPGVARLGPRSKERVLVLRHESGSSTIAVETLVVAGLMELDAGGGRALALSLPRATPEVPEPLTTLAGGIEAWRRLPVTSLVAAFEENPGLVQHLTPELLLELPTSVRLALLDRASTEVPWSFPVELRHLTAQRGLAADVRAYRSPGVPLRWRNDRLVDSEGRVWSATTTALVDPEGERFPRLPSHFAYRFAVESWPTAR